MGDYAKPGQVRHGMRYTRVWSIWMNMIQRCTNERSTGFANYGGRGIDVAEPWLRFERFYSDMGDPPLGTTIDRIDNDGNYEPGNCRWATRQVQSRNTRSARLLVHEGKSLSVVEWSEITGIPYYTLHARLRRGWSDSLALTAPVIPYQKVVRR